MTIQSEFGWRKIYCKRGLKIVVALRFSCSAIYRTTVYVSHSWRSGP